MKDLKQAIRDKALETGFDAVGFCSAEGDEGDRRNLRDYLAAERHGTMSWIADSAQRRSSPRALWEAARSVVVVATNYAPADDPREMLSRPRRGVISAYARRRDYHDVIKKRLKRLGRWMAETTGCGIKVFVDTAPVMEKPLAVRAGLGWRGKHGVVVSRRLGSWMFLGEVFTTLELPPDAPHGDHCGSCERCRVACPTDALAEPYRIDARRCVSYLTTELDGPIEPALGARMGNRIFGCDDCLAACPWNKFAPPGGAEWLPLIPRLEAPPLAELAALEEDAFGALFATTPVKRGGRDRLVRNVLIAIANSADPSLAPAARVRLDDPSPTVRQTAAWALQRLEGDEG